MNIAEILYRHASERPDAIAILDPHRGATRATTFAELDVASARAASLLAEHGLKPGDAVLVFHPMSAELYVALMAMFRMRLVAMFVDPSAGQQHIERCCRLVPPQALVASAKAHLLRLRSRAIRAIPTKISIG